MGLKRKLASIVEHATRTRIVRPHDIALLFEEDHLRRFYRHFKIDCVFDVGANVGQYAMMIRERAAYTGPIISFEPNPDAAATLRKKAERDTQWLVEEVALGTDSGKAPFHVMVEDQMSSLRRPQTTETKLFIADVAIQQTIDVKLSTLAIEFRKYRQTLRFKRPFLKLDTQGSDLDIAAGAGEMLSEFVGLQSELAIKRIYADAPRFDEALKFYTDQGFVLSAFVPNNRGHFPYLIEIDCIMFNKAAEGMRSN
jgi:FkbM family methyltransferase